MRYITSLVMLMGVGLGQTKVDYSQIRNAPLQMMNCYTLSSCSAAVNSGYLIWRNPSTIPIGEAAGLKINVSNNIGATPGLGDVIGLQVRSTDDSITSGRLWGADIIAQQGTVLYHGSASIVISGGGTVWTVTTTSPHHLLAGQGQAVYFTGAGALDGFNWGIDTIIDPTSFTIVPVPGLPDQTIAATMDVSTNIRSIEAEVGSVCTADNKSDDAYGGFGCRANGIEITGIGATGYLTAAIATYVNNADPNKYWYSGLEINKVKTYSIKDRSDSTNVFGVLGTHTSLFDFTSLTSLSYMAFGPSAGMNMVWANAKAFSIHTTTTNDTDNRFSIVSPDGSGVNIFPSVPAAAFTGMAQDGDSMVMAGKDTLDAASLLLTVGTTNNLGVRIDGTNNMIEQSVESNYTETSGGVANAITATVPTVILASGVCVTIKLPTTLQAGANTLALNGGTAKDIKKHTDPSANLGIGYATGSLWKGCYDGTLWQDMAQ